MNYDVEAAKKLIRKELGCNNSDAKRLAERIQYLHPSLEPYIQAWINGLNMECEFNGVSTALIMEKERCPYIMALYSMSVLMEKPYLIDSYLSSEYFVQ